MQPRALAGNSLNEHQANRLLVTCTYIDKLLSDIESALSAASSKSPFPKYVSDLSPAQRRVIEDYITKFRAQLVRVLHGMGIPVPKAHIGAAHSIRTALTFVDIAVEELMPKYMRGYGEVPENAKEALNGIVAELSSLVRQLDSYIGMGLGGDLANRLKVLEALGQIDVHGLQIMEQIIARHGLVEFRPALTALLDRLEDQTFEIAVFGRVSSGKSSLLNRILETDLLPVGVTPITAVPTRIRVGQQPSLSVTFAGFRAESFDVSHISEFATEQENPGNSKHVAKLVVTLPSSKLKEGITFVDTPGLGSLAAAGANETLAYLPRCDFAVVLIDAGATLTNEDIDLMRVLYETGINSSVLLSKADLITEQQGNQILRYIEDQIQAAIGIRISAIPVSALPPYQKLLDDWYQQHLIPLFQNSSDLRAQSVARKMGSLRASLESTLQSLQSKSERGSSESFAKAEDTLRRFAGKFVQLSKDTDKILDELVGAADAIIRQATEKCLQHDGNQTELSPRIQSEIDAIANGFGGRVSTAIELLIPEIIEQLDSTARGLSIAARHNEREFSSIVREMPRFECPAIPAGSIRYPQLVGMLGDGMAARSVAEQVRKAIGKPLSESLSYYRTMLRSWSEAIINRLHSTFDSFADLYRGQIRRELMRGASKEIVSPDDIERDLKRLNELTESREMVREKEVDRV